MPVKAELELADVSGTAPRCVIGSRAFVIGRSGACDYVVDRATVSREHAAVWLQGDAVHVRDLRSRNGTFVNGERVGEEAVLLSGDILRVGPLEFEMLIEQTAAKIKRPKVSDIKEAVARTAEGAGGSSTGELGDVEDWLDEGDLAARQRKVLDPDTRQFRLDDTENPDTQVTIQEASAADTKSIDAGAKRPDKKAAGKLPPRPSTQLKDSREAAADMLKKFFNRR